MLFWYINEKQVFKCERIQNKDPKSSTKVPQAYKSKIHARYSTKALLTSTLLSLIFGFFKWLPFRVLGLLFCNSAVLLGLTICSVLVTGFISLVNESNRPFATMGHVTYPPLNVILGTLWILEMERAGKKLVELPSLRSVALKCKIWWQFKSQKY